MAESAPQRFFVSFENVSASVGGVDISAIMELRLMAAANSIPQLTLLVDITAEGDRGVAAAMSLDNAREALSICREMVRRDGATLSLSLTCRLEGPGGAGVQTQSLSINGWLLTDVALSTVQRQGVCTASLTFMHPICKAHFGGAVPSLLAVPPMLTDIEDGNPLAVFVRALRVYANVQRSMPLAVAIPGASPAEVVREQLLKRLDKATSDLEAAVEWTHGGLPAFAHLAGWSSQLCQGLAVYAEPSGGNSVLQALLGGLIPECSLALGGDYTKGKLELGPFEPWADASLSISDSDIASLDFPQADPSPVSGVQMLLSYTGSDMYASYYPGACQAGEGAYPAWTFYVPDSEFSRDYLYGPIQQFSEPGWLVAMSNQKTAQSSADAADATTAPQGHLVMATTVPRGGGASFSSGGEEGPAIRSTVEYASAVLACAKAYFETSLMKDWAFTVTARLMFSAQGGLLCPGRVISVKAGSGEVLGGYVTAVEHVISVPSKAATTRVMCSHPRFGALPEAVTSSTNALYA